jgi:hypothetical protein
MGARAELAHGRERINLPQRRLGPQAAKRQRKSAILRGQLVVGKLKAVFEPVQKRRLEDAALPIERIAREPDDLRLMKAQLSDLLQLRPQLVHLD